LLKLQQTTAILTILAPNQTHTKNLKTCDFSFLRS